MANFGKEKIRNIALIGHGGEGKTSLAEAMLYEAGMIPRLGKVDDGSTACDFDAEEIGRKMSISLSLCRVEREDCKFNIVDVPGFFDFEGEMTAALSVCDGAIVVTQASGALTVGTEKAIDYCGEKKIPVMIFVNGVNKENSDFDATIDAIRAKYGKKVSAIELPIMRGNEMTGYVDVLTGKARSSNGEETEVPASLAEKVSGDSAELTEVAAGATEELMEKFFDEGGLSADDTIAGIKGMVLSCEFIPVMAGVATGKPVLAGLFANIINFFPCPGERGPEIASCGEEKTEFNFDADGKFVCRVFKTIVDPFAGKLSLFKVINGKVKSGDGVRNVNRGESERISALYFLNGKQQTAAEAVSAGDMGAFAKLNYTSTGDTLCDPSMNCELPPIDFPQPVYTLALVPDDKGTADKVVDGLRKLMEEDCTFRVEKNSETQETVVRGMGETQIDVLCKKVKNKYKVEARLAEPRVAYRETIRKTVEQHGRCKKQTGGSGLFGDVYIRFEPAPDTDFEFREEVVGGNVPKQFFPSVEKGLREIKSAGVLAGCPMVNFRATLYDGSSHPVDSKEAAFIEAAKIAYREGIPKASPVLLEPIWNVRIVIPSEYMGDIMGDITKRRGKIFVPENVKGKTVVTGEVPAAEMGRYAIDLRSMTQGRGRFTTEFARYDEVPQSMAAKIIEEEKKKRSK